MKRVDLAWMAGIFDGEGSIHITRLNPTQSYKSIKYTLHFYVGNTNLEMLKELKSFLGGSLTLDARKDLPNSKPFWHWNLGPKAGYLVIKQLLPYFRIKKERAELAIKFYELCKSQKRKIIRGEKGTAIGTARLTNEAIKSRDDIYYQMKMLNHKGL